MTRSPFGLLGNKPVIQSELVNPGRKRLVDFANHRLVAVLTVLGFGLPMVGYFWLLGHYSIDTIVGDQLDDVVVIKQSYVHFFDWSPMWVQHNENRLFFPNIIVVFLAHTVHFNVQVEEYLGAVMLTAATFFILLAHKRRSPSTPWLFYCPVAFLAFSVVQYQNTIWGFQMAWFMVLLALATSLVLLDRATLTWIIFVAALAAAVVGSFSSLQGLLIWPTGLVLLYFRRRTLPYIGVWIVGAIVTTTLYFHHYDSSASPLPNFAWQHPLGALKFFLFAIGDVVGKPVGLGRPDSANLLVELFGLCIVLLAVATVLICGFQRDVRGGSPVGIALICYGLLFAAMITQGRSFFGYYGASQSRYTTFDLLILIGIYLALLSRRGGAQEDLQLPFDEPRLRTQTSNARERRGSHSRPYRTATLCIWIVALIAIGIQIPLGIYYGVHGARNSYDYDVKVTRVLRNINHASNDALIALYPFEPASIIRDRVRVLEVHRLSVFSDDGMPVGR